MLEIDVVKEPLRLLDCELDVTIDESDELGAVTVGELEELEEPEELEELDDMVEDIGLE